MLSPNVTVNFGPLHLSLGTARCKTASCQGELRSYPSRSNASLRYHREAAGKAVRRLAENQYVQIAFHVAGGLGLGLFVSPWLQPKAAVVLGVVLMSAAVLGHWYAVLSDPNNKRSRRL